LENYRPAVGTSIQELDTPCLMIDMEALEHNYRFVAKTYKDSQCKMRAHVKNTKSPIVAHLQIREGGTVGGVCTAKVAEAEVMTEGGIEDILIPNQVVTDDKITRLCSVAERAKVTVGIDSAENVRNLSRIASERGVNIGVVIEVDTSMGRAGIRNKEQGVELAKLAHSLPGVDFKGVMSHQTLDGSPDRETRYIWGRKYIQQCLDVKDAIEAEGIPVEVVSSGETFTIDVAATIPGVTEVEGGTYALMSHNFDYMDDLRYAAKILCTVVSAPRPGIVVADVGSRALASPGGVKPFVEDMPHLTAEALHEEHIVFKCDGGTLPEVGDKLVLISGQQDMLTNRWDQYVAVRDGSVEAVWDITARGCHN
jgi:3-hydroxy-D-aspartate aldolase